MRISDIHWTWWVAAVVVTLAVLAAISLTGCNTVELPFAKSQARQKAALIADRKAEIVELTAELTKLEKEAADDPTPKKIEKAEEAKTVLEAKVEDTTKLVRDLNELLAAIADSEEAVERTTEQAKEAAAYLPSPWREIALMVGTFGSTLAWGRGRSKVLADAARSEAEAVGIAAIRSVDAVLLPEQRQQIKQGAATKALVDKAQGKL